jgi:hypothetical protein
MWRDHPRIARLRTFPVAVIGIAATTSSMRGHLHEAMPLRPRDHRRWREHEARLAYP